jgi:hypothetical protein
MNFRKVARINIGSAVVVIILDGHEVDDGNNPRFCPEAGFQNIGVLDILLGCLDTTGGGADAEVAADVLVEKSSENARRIKARKAAPVYGAVGSDKRRR